MPYNLLLFPLLSGYLFLHAAHYFRFRAQRLDGYRLLIESAIAGTVVGAIARALIVLFSGSEWIRGASSYWAKLAPWPDSEVAGLSLVVGLGLALAVNLVIDKDRAKSLEVERQGSSIIRLLFEAEKSDELISITLDNLKWYVGYVTEIPNLDPSETHFRLLPIFSGYREKESLETFRTVFYEDALIDPARDPEDFVVTLPLADVKMACLFDSEIYEKYFCEEDEEEEVEASDAGTERAGSASAIAISKGKPGATLSFTQDGNAIRLTFQGPPAQ